jgi:ribosomal protein L30/L7E
MTEGVLPNSSEANSTKGRKQKQDSTWRKLTLNRISKSVENTESR